MAANGSPSPELNISLRPASEDDGSFLYTLYRTTREDEVAQFGWDAAQTEAFLQMQFDVRKRSYAIQVPAAVTHIVLFGGMEAGSMIVDRNNECVSLTDIAILPEYRGKGIATHLICELQREAAAGNKPLTLSVDKNNPAAFRLYGSLGFIVTDESEINYTMQWKV